jgi:hypothetical protein
MSKVRDVRPADAFHVVAVVEGERPVYRREPCEICPWRVDATGQFPAEAFRMSASTAYDGSPESFGCHESGLKKPAICAGFLCNGATHNMQVRWLGAMGDIGDDVSDGGHNLFEDYRAMAIANGVDPDDPALSPCRGPRD